MTVALPYRSASEWSVQAGAWQLRSGDRFVPAPQLLSSWDCETDLTFKREIVIDRDALLDETNLPPEAELRLSVQWEVSDSRLRAVASTSAMDERTSGLIVEFTLPGRSLGGTLSLSTAIFLVNPLPPSSGIPTAHLMGSVLWRDTPKKVRLTGDASRMPIAVANFGGHGRDPLAPWAILVDGPLDAPAMGAVQLLLNDRRSDVLALIDRPEDNPVAAQVVQSALYVAVGRALVERACIDEDLTEDQEFPDDSLGAVLLGAIRLRFPGLRLDDLRLLRRDDPSRFTAMVDGRFGLFDGVLG